MWDGILRNGKYIHADDYDGPGFVTIGQPVYRNPINPGPVRPTIKQRLGPRNYHNVLRIGQYRQPTRPFSYHRAAYVPRPNYTWTPRERERDEEEVGPSHPTSAHTSGSVRRHETSGRNRADSRDRHTRSLSPSRRGAQDKKTGLASGRRHSKTSEKSNIVIKRDLRKGKRTVEYNSTSRKNDKDRKTDKAGTSKKSSSNSTETKTSHAKSHATRADAQPKSTETETNSKDKDEVKAASRSPEMIIIESISGDSSEDGEEKAQDEEEDVEVLQLRREALAAMVKKMDESIATTSSKKLLIEASIDSSKQKAEAVPLAVSRDSVTVSTPSSITPNTAANLDTEEINLRQKLLADISRKRKLEESPSLPSPKIAAINDTLNSKPKHSPIKFPTGVSNAKKSTGPTTSKLAEIVRNPAAQKFDLRDTLRHKAANAQGALGTAPVYDNHGYNLNFAHNRKLRKALRLRHPHTSQNRAFSNKYQHGVDMRTLRITIPNEAKKVIIPLNVPSTEEEEGSASGSEREREKEREREAEVRRKTHKKKQKHIDSEKENRSKRNGKETNRGDDHHHGHDRASNNEIDQMASIISPEELPESFQRKLAKLLQDAKEDCRREAEQEKELEKRRKKEELIRDLQQQAKRIEEEEEKLREEKAQLEHLKAERSRKLLNKVKAKSTSPKSISSSFALTCSITSSPPAKSPSISVDSSLAFDAKSNFQALKHLPIHKQVEYIRLQSQILEHEHKISEARFSLGISGAQEMSVDDTRAQITPIEKNGIQSVDHQFTEAENLSNLVFNYSGAGSANMTSSNEELPSTVTEMQALFQREKLLKATLMEKMEISQNHLMLKAKENELVNARKASVDAMAVLVSAIMKQSHSRLACQHLEEKITMLQHQLKVTTDSLREEQCRLDASSNAIENATNQIDNMKEQCETLEKSCLDLGKKAKGEDYKLTKQGAEAVNKKIAEVERTSKVAALSLPLKKSKVGVGNINLGGSLKTTAQMLRLKAVARARRIKHNYNWRRPASAPPASPSSSAKKKRDSLAAHERGPGFAKYLSNPESGDEDEFVLLPKCSFGGVLTAKMRPNVEKKSNRLGMDHYEPYVSPLRLIADEDGGFLREQMTGMAIRKIHPAVTLCYFELRGFCNSDACSFQHLYRPNLLQLH